MRIPLSAGSRSASVKVLVIGILTLALLIPLGMIRTIIGDRQSHATTAAMDIRHAWGGDQTVTGPVLRLPYELEKQTVYGLPYVDEKSVYLIADELTVDADVVTELRYRGIHEVPVFSALVTMTVRIDFAVLEKLGITPQHIRWSAAELFLGVSDPAVLRQVPAAGISSREVSFTAGGPPIEGIDSQLRAPVGELLGTEPPAAPLTLAITLTVNGSGALQFVPLADSATVTMSANWGSPSFTGRQLPSAREIRADSFDADWRSTRLGRSLPLAWTNTRKATAGVSLQAFGARFMQTVGLYQLLDRSTKYAVLIIGLTFVACFLMEIIARLRLHPLQYLLIGLANTLFYLLLLSLSEHVGFDAAFALSGASSTLLIAGYSAAVLTGRARATIMAGALTALYAFLYLTLKAESFALLAGSLGLWLALAAIMYLTRRIDWYGDSVQKQASAS